MEGCEARGSLPPRRPCWRSLRRALRQAQGLVLYARQWAWSEDELEGRRCHTSPVAYRDAQGLWIIDWSALSDVEDWPPGRAVDICWEDWLTADQRLFLHAMRLVHDRLRLRDRRVGPLVRKLLGDGTLLAELADTGWVICRPHGPGPSGEPEYRAVIGSVSVSRHIGDFTGISDAEHAARAAIDDARAELARRLVAKGGLAAEFAAARSRWPEPSVRYAPSWR